MRYYIKLWSGRTRYFLGASKSGLARFEQMATRARRRHRDVQRLRPSRQCVWNQLEISLGAAGIQPCMKKGSTTARVAMPIALNRSR